MGSVRLQRMKASRSLNRRSKLGGAWCAEPATGTQCFQQCRHSIAHAAGPASGYILYIAVCMLPDSATSSSCCCCLTPCCTCCCLPHVQLLFSSHHSRHDPQALVAVDAVLHTCKVGRPAGRTSMQQHWPAVVAISCTRSATCCQDACPAAY
jgi:hypothetical protein